VKVRKPQDFDIMSKEMKRVVLKIRVLHRIMAGQIYSYALIKEFEKLGFGKFIGPTLKNDTYNVLKSLEKSGYITPITKMEKGRVKIYYSITKRGRVATASLFKLLKKSLSEASGLLE